MDLMGRRKFIKYIAASAAVTIVGAISAYFVTRKPETTPNDSSRLPPGQSEVQSLEALSVSQVPQISMSDWAFEAYGEVENPVTLSWDQFTQLPKIVDVSDFHCVTGWTKLDNTWEGVRLEEIMKLVRPTAKAKYVTIECYGTPFYTASLPLEDLLQEHVLFAYGLDGKPVPPGFGGPLRLVVPQKYGYKSAKWVRRVKFTETQERGFWETRGYSDTADPWTNDRYG